jgi:hypothetical protein
MSTITSIPSVAKTLFETFQPAVHKYDYRTERGKFFKSVSTHATVIVETGVADLVTERQQWNDATESYDTSYETHSYDALYVTINADIHDVLATVEAYLREIAPTRTVYGDNSSAHTLPNFVRIATEKVYVEGRSDGYYGRDEYLAFNVLNAYIDPVTDSLVSFYEVVERDHKWHSNPFLEIDSWRRDKEDIASLHRYQTLWEDLDNGRKSKAVAEHRGALIVECVEAGLANKSLGYDTAVRSVETFIEKFNAVSDDAEAPRYPIQHAFNVAYETSLVRLSEYFLSVIGKSTWQVSSNTFQLSGRSYYYTEAERNEERPLFINEVSAYALAVEWFVKDDWDRTPESAKTEVLKRFSDLIRGYYR